MAPNTYALEYDAPDAADDDVAYPESLFKIKNKKKSMNPNSDAINYDAPDDTYDDAASPNSLILDSSLKRRIWIQVNA